MSAFEDGQLRPESTVKESLTVAADADDLKTIEDLERDLKRKGGKS